MSPPHSQHQQQCLPPSPRDSDSELDPNSETVTPVDNTYPGIPETVNDDGYDLFTTPVSAHGTPTVPTATISGFIWNIFRRDITTIIFIILMIFFVFVIFCRFGRTGLETHLGGIGGAGWVWTTLLTLNKTIMSQKNVPKTHSVGPDTPIADFNGNISSIFQSSNALLSLTHDHLVSIDNEPKVTIGIATMLNTTDMLLEWIEYHIDQGVTEFYLCIDVIINRNTSEDVMESFSLYEEFYQIHHPDVNLFFYQTAQFDSLPAMSLDDHLSLRRMKNGHDYYQIASVAALSRAAAQRTNRKFVSTKDWNKDVEMEQKDFSVGYILDLLKALPTYVMWIDADEFVGSRQYPRLIDYLTAVPTLEDGLGESFRSGTLSDFSTWMKPYGLGDAELLGATVHLERDNMGEVVVNYIPLAPYYNPEVVFESAFVQPSPPGDARNDDINDNPESALRGPFHPETTYVDPRSRDDSKGRLLRLEGLTREMADPGVYLYADKQKDIFKRAVDIFNAKMDLELQVGVSEPNQNSRIGTRDIDVATDFPFLLNRKRYTAVHSKKFGHTMIDPPSSMDFLRTVFAIMPECAFGMGQQIPLKRQFENADDPENKYSNYEADRFAELGSNLLPAPNAARLLELSNEARAKREEMRGLKLELDSVPETERDNDEYKSKLSYYNDLKFFYSDVEVYPLGRRSRIGTPFIPRLFDLEHWKNAAAQRYVAVNQLKSKNKKDPYNHYSDTLIEDDMHPPYCQGFAPGIYQMDKTVTYTPFYYERLESTAEAVFSYLQSQMVELSGVSVSPDAPSQSPPKSRFDSIPMATFDRIAPHICNKVQIHNCAYRQVSGTTVWEGKNDIFIEHKAIPSLYARFNKGYTEVTRTPEMETVDDIKDDDNTPFKGTRRRWAYMAIKSNFKGYVEHIHDTLADFRRQIDENSGSKYPKIADLYSDKGWYITDKDAYDVNFERHRLIDSENVDEYHQLVRAALYQEPLPPTLEQELRREYGEVQFPVPSSNPTTSPKANEVPYFGVVGEGEVLTYPFHQLYYDRRATGVERNYDPRTVLSTSFWANSLLGDRFDEAMRRYREGESDDDEHDYVYRILKKYKPKRADVRASIVDDENVAMGFRVVYQKV